jgi:hypothetical protein
MKQRRRKGIRGLILALATAAVLVPAANGHIYDTGSTGYVNSTSVEAQGYTPQALKAMNERWTQLAQHYQDARNAEAVAGGSYGGLYPGSGAGPGSTVTGSTRPDDRGGIRGVGTAAPDLVDRQLANLDAKAAQVAQSFHVDDRAGIRGPGPIETPAVVSSHGDGFDWTDAGIGASVALVAAVMLAAATLMRRRAGLAV